MAAKKLQVSIDAGTTYLTLPGSTAERRAEMSDFTDTVFGQNYQSRGKSIGTWSINGNSYFKGVAGYVAVLKIGGTPITMTAEACTLVSGKTYQITAAIKRVIDYATAFTVLDNAVDRTSNVISIDYLNGTVTFAAGYTVVGPVTVTGKYVPLAVLTKGRSFSLTQTNAPIDTTTYEAAQANGGWRTNDYGLSDVKLEVKGINDLTVDQIALMATRNMLYIDIALEASGTTFFRGTFKRGNYGSSGNVGALEEVSTTFDLFVPDGQLVATPFSWYFPAGSLINTAIKNVINCWQGFTKPLVKYLPDGGTTALAGHFGASVVTECTLSNSFDGQNEFRFTFMGDGAPTAV